MSKQNGYTINELLIAVFGLVVVALLGGALYAAVHFIAKFW